MNDQRKREKIKECRYITNHKHNYTLCPNTIYTMHKNKHNSHIQKIKQTQKKKESAQR
jgi:hypothetical protein